MTTEYFVDRVSNISVQGPVVTIDLGRMVAAEDAKDTFNLQNRVTLTLTGQNFIALANTFNQTVKAISDRQTANKTDTGSKSKEVAPQLKKK